MKHITKIRINLLLTVAFVLVFVTGMLLHLKKHGIEIEPREVLKVAHAAAGFLMIACALCHVWFTSKVFRIVAASHLPFLHLSAGSGALLRLRHGVAETSLSCADSSPWSRALLAWHHHDRFCRRPPLHRFAVAFEELEESSP